MIDNSPKTPLQSKEALNASIKTPLTPSTLKPYSPIINSILFPIVFRLLVLSLRLVILSSYLLLLNAFQKWPNSLIQSSLVEIKTLGFPKCEYYLEETKEAYQLLFNESFYDEMFDDKEKFLVEFFKYSNMVFGIVNVIKKDKDYDPSTADDEDYVPKVSLSEPQGKRKKQKQVISRLLVSKEDSSSSNVSKVKDPILKERLSIFKELTFEQIDYEINEDIIEKMENKQQFRNTLEISLDHIIFSTNFKTESDLIQRRMLPLSSIFPYPKFELISDAQFPGLKTRPDFRERISNTIGEAKLIDCLRRSNYKDIYNAIFLPREVIRTEETKTGLGFVHDKSDAFVFWHDETTTVQVAHFKLSSDSGTKQFFYSLIENALRAPVLEASLFGVFNQYLEGVAQTSTKPGLEIIELNSEHSNLSD